MSAQPMLSRAEGAYGSAFALYWEWKGILALGMRKKEFL